MYSTSWENMVCGTRLKCIRRDLATTDCPPHKLCFYRRDFDQQLIYLKRLLSKYDPISYFPLSRSSALPMLQKRAFIFDILSQSSEVDDIKETIIREFCLMNEDSK